MAEKAVIAAQQLRRHQQRHGHLGLVADARHARVHGDVLEARQVQQAVHVGRVGQQQRVEHARRDVTALVRRQHAQQAHVVDDDKEQPHAQRDARRRRAFSHQRADEVAHRQKARAQQHAGPDQHGKGPPRAGIHAAIDPLQRQSRRPVARAGGNGQDGQVADELAHDDLPSRHRIAEQQGHGAAVDLADDCVIGQQHGDERHQEDGKAGQADHRDGQGIDLDCAGGSAAQEAQRQRQRGQEDRGGKDPAVAQAVADFLADDCAYGVHASSRSSRWA